MVFFIYQKEPPVLLFGGSMLPIILFWIFFSAMLVVFGVDIAQKRRGGMR
jgi:uncharacterized BrkB/YihY/UPF0761 family membrane protein